MEVIHSKLKYIYYLPFNMRFILNFLTANINIYIILMYSGVLCLTCNIHIQVVVGGCNDVNDISAKKKAKKQGTWIQRKNEHFKWQTGS